MPRRDVRWFDDLEAVCRAAADKFVHAYFHATQSHGTFRVALAGGSTPSRLYQLLTQPPYREQVCWEHVAFYFGDERAVPPDHADSNYRMALETMLSELDIPPARVQRMRAEQPDLDAAARSYEVTIAEDFGVAVDGPPPRFDLVLLGMGDDGHTASLFPGTHALHERKRWVVGNEVPKLGASRMTFTYPLINCAHQVLFMIAGGAKAEALAAVLEGPRNREQFPSQGVEPEPGLLLMLIDRAAAEHLTQ